MSTPDVPSHNYKVLAPKIMLFLMLVAANLIYAGALTIPVLCEMHMPIWTWLSISVGGGLVLYGLYRWFWRFVPPNSISPGIFMCLSTIFCFVASTCLMFVVPSLDHRYEMSQTIHEAKYKIMNSAGHDSALFHQVSTWSQNYQEAQKHQTELESIATANINPSSVLASQSVVLTLSKAGIGVPSLIKDHLSQGMVWGQDQIELRNLMNDAISNPSLTETQKSKLMMLTQTLH